MKRSAAYPEPVRTETNAVFLDAWRRGELLLQRCDRCTAFVFFPRPHCPACWSERLTWTPLAGTGVVVSYSLVHSHVTEPFASESPVVFAEVRLTEGASMLARVVAVEPGRVASGIGVRLVPLPDAAQYPLPTFRPAG